MAFLSGEQRAKQKRNTLTQGVPFLFKDKETTGFEPVRRLNTGSADFESAALPLCHVSKSQLCYYSDSRRF